MGGRNVQPHYEEISMFSHRNAQQLSTFLVLRTANNMTLTLSPGHYLFVNGGSKLLRAGDTRIGDLVWTLPESRPGASPLLAPTKVVDIQSSMQEGLYNPHTISGTIIVNQLAAATFTDTIPPSFLVHYMLTLPAITLNMVLPSFVADWLNNLVLAVHFGSKPVIVAILGAISKGNGPIMV